MTPRYDFPHRVRDKGRKHDMTDDTAAREYARRLFAEDDYGDNWPTAGTTPAAPTEPKRGNHVPREGNNPASQPSGDAEMREYTRELFDRAYFTN